MIHPNTDQLRDYRFDLLPPQHAARIAEHLESCADCRAELDRISRQFGALELLRHQPEVSEPVIEKILRTEASQPRRLITYWKPLLGTAASILFIAGILHLGPHQPARENSFITPTTEKKSPAPAPASQRIFTAKDSRSAHALPASSARKREQPPTTLRSLAELRAEPAFPPASNIELNVLPRRDEVQLTIYNEEDLTLVREKRKLVLNRGWNWLQFMWSNTLIDPTSLTLEPKTHADRIEITQLVYPPRLNDIARWTIFSEIDGEAEFELTYFTSGLKWNAFYEATLSPNEQSMKLRSFVRVDNGSGEDYENAQTRLVVGEINLKDNIAELAKRHYAYGDPRPVDLFGAERVSTVSGIMADYSRAENEEVVEGDDLFECEQTKEVIKQALSEYQLYTIEGRETIPDGWGKRLPSFEAQEIGVTNLYKFDPQRWGKDTIHFLSFANTETCKLGKNPLPNGSVRVFGSPGYLGTTAIEYIPVGEEINLSLGIARKVKVEPKLTCIRYDNPRFDTEGNTSGYDEISTWEIELTNTKNIPITLEITRCSGDAFSDLFDTRKLYNTPSALFDPEFNHWKINTATPYEKYDVSHFRFTVELEPQSSKIIEYELTRYMGTRIDVAMSTDPED